VCAEHSISVDAHGHGGVLFILSSNAVSPPLRSTCYGRLGVSLANLLFQQQYPPLAMRWFPFLSFHRIGARKFADLPHPRVGCPGLVRFPQLDADLTLKVGAVCRQSRLDIVVDLARHELRRCHGLVGEDLVQVLQVVAFEDVRHDLRRLANVDDPVGLGMEAVGLEFDIARVRRAVHLAGRSERRVLVEAVGDHEGIADAQGEGHVAWRGDTERPSAQPTERDDERQDGSGIW